MRLLYRTSPMESLRKWFYKPKRDDRSLLAQFFFADDALNMVAAELDSFDGRKDPERCSTLVNQLRHAQDRVLNITSQIMDQLLGDERVARSFRVKFPEDVLQDNLAGQLWFGAECLAAGSSIMNREEESAAMRPLAKALTRSLETVRSLLREQCLRPRNLALSQHDDMLHESLRIFDNSSIMNREEESAAMRPLAKALTRSLETVRSMLLEQCLRPRNLALSQHDDMLHESLTIFDKLFAEFELCYVSAMVTVKTPHEFEAQQLICVLFSESLRRALKQGLLTQEQVDMYDPALMFAVPRLAIVSGLLIYSSGPLSIDKTPDEMSDMFRPFRTLLHKIRSLLWTLDRRELITLERLLCSNEDVTSLQTNPLPIVEQADDQYPDIGDFVSRFYADHVHCRDLYTSQQSTSEPTITDADYLPDNIEVMTPLIDGMIRLSEDGPAVDSRTDTNDDTDSASTDTFQDKDLSRKTSRVENDMLRNLSTSGLMMFDPLVINAASSSSENRQMPDTDLVTSLNEQVTEIADRLSSIANDADVMMEHQIHSFSTNDVPTLISSDNTEAFAFTGPRNEQLSGLPSTSHGYLIPNAISQEPIVLSSLSHNNSAVFNENDNADNSAILNSDLPLIIPENIDSEIVNTNISIANANLSSLLLTNEEYRHNFLDNNEEADDSASFHSATMNIDRTDDERVKFILGYESDNQESAVDSGVSTENTSLDRSPETENKDINKEHYMKQNRVLKSPSGECTEQDKDKENVLENSFSECTDRIEGDVTVNLNYTEENQSKNEASSSHCEVTVNKERDSSIEEEDHVNIEEVRRRVLQEWGANPRRNAEGQEFRSIDDYFEDKIRRHSIRRAIHLTRAEEASSSTRQKKVKKSSSKSKKKKSKMWRPGIVVIENRAALNHNSPLRLNLEHLVDEGTTSASTIPECADDEQIALALQAQELAARQQARGKFKSSEDLIHRLFVCIAGVADQLQTNFAADLRNILKSVFLMNQTPEAPEAVESKEEMPSEDRKQAVEYEATEDQVIQNGSSFDSVYSAAEEVYADSNSSDSVQSENPQLVRRNTVNSSSMAAEQATTSAEQRRKSESKLQSSASTGDLTQCGAENERAPEWVPDIAAPECMRCAAHFTAFRRRHHCRNCGKVFCASCSSNSIPLPRYGQMKPVRVCEECFSSIARSCRGNGPSAR